MQAVSIIMKVWNASQHVRLCLETLLEHTTHPYELIVVDNGSKPRLVDYLRRQAERFDHFHLIENARNMGPGHANRQGAGAAQHPLLCLLDSDVLVPSGWLERLVDDFHNNPRLKILSAMQHEESVRYPFPSGQNDSRQIWFEVERQNIHLEPARQFRVYSHDLSIDEFDSAVRAVNPPEIRELVSPPDFVSSFCTLVDSVFAEQVGGIAAPQFQGYGSEDVDLCWRVGQAGGGVAKTTGVYVHHFQGSSLEDNRLERQSALRMANRILYARWRDHLLRLVVQKVQEQAVDPLTYLESHFIYAALAQHTDFIQDVRVVLNDPYIPEDLVWRPQQS
jgi:GT2 family glycosyltransferase